MLFEDVVSIKQHNLKKLITTIRFNDGLTKKDIANQTLLSAATITNLCAELIAKGVISEGDLNTGPRVGRTPNLMKFLYDRFYVLALDFQYDKAIGLAIVNLRNEICFSDTIFTSEDVTAEEIIALAQQRLLGVVKEMGIGAQIIGLGASVPAVYDRNDGLIQCSAIARYQSIPLKKMLSEKFGYPAYVDNCANIRVISAYAQNPSSNIVCLDVSQGVGCGAVIDGEVLRGKNGYATELAHIPLGDRSRKCPICGSYGCVETDLNVENIVSQFPQIDQSLSLPEKWKRCTAMLFENPQAAHDMLQYIGALLGQIASLLLNVFDPGDFYVTGLITDIFPLIQESFWKEIHSRSPESIPLGRNIIIQPCAWNDVYIGIADSLYHRWLP